MEEIAFFPKDLRENAISDDNDALLKSNLETIFISSDLNFCKHLMSLTISCNSDLLNVIKFQTLKIHHTRIYCVKNLL